MRHAFAPAFAHHAFRGAKPAIDALPDAMVDAEAPVFLQAALGALHGALVSEHLRANRARVLDHVFDALSVAGEGEGAAAVMAHRPFFERGVLEGGGDHESFVARAEQVDALAGEDPEDIVAAVHALVSDAIHAINVEEEAVEEDDPRAHLTAQGARATLVRRLVKAVLAAEAAGVATLPGDLSVEAMRGQEWALAIHPLLSGPAASTSAGLDLMAASLDAHFGTSAFTLAAGRRFTKSPTHAVLRAMELQRCAAVGGLWLPAQGACDTSDIAPEDLVPTKGRAACEAEHHVWLRAVGACMVKSHPAAPRLCVKTGGSWVEDGGCRAPYSPAAAY